MRRGAAGFAGQSNLPSECNPMTTSGPFAPKNLSGKPVFCEEVHVDPPESTFVTQPAAGQNSRPSLLRPRMPPPTAASSISRSRRRNQGRLDSRQFFGYALRFARITSRLAFMWKQSTQLATPWWDCICRRSYFPTGSGRLSSRKIRIRIGIVATRICTTPATIRGVRTRRRAPAAFMRAAKAAVADFVDSAKKPIQLGNSFVEFNAGVPPHKASCMTCHSPAMILAGPPPTQIRMLSLRTSPGCSGACPRSDVHPGLPRMMQTARQLGLRETRSWVETSCGMVIC